MGKKSIGTLLFLTLGTGMLLSGCGQIDESILDTQANLSINISVPYPTATPLPDHLNVPDAIVIDSDGNVTLNDESYISGDFQSVSEQEDATEYKSLSLGNTGIGVQALQTRLKELGYFDGDVSGLFDMQTENAVKRFEQTYGTMQTGVATAKLQMKLFASSAPAYGSQAYEDAVISQYTVLKPGAVGSSVYALQQRLKRLNYPISDLSGVFDQETAQAVRLFYQAYGLKASDVVSVALQMELYSDSARDYKASDASASGADVDFSDSANALVPGDSGDLVLDVQRRLIELGYLLSGNDTGNFDENTQRAVNHFLKNLGYEATGILTVENRLALFDVSAPSYADESAGLYSDLNIGDTGEEVMDLQRRLVELGYADGTPNGKYGNATIKAVKIYQEANGLEADGLASARFLAMLYSDSALTYDEAVNGQQDFSGADDGDDEYTEGSGISSEATEPVQENNSLYFRLVPGSIGAAVANLENRLVELGFLEEADNVYDSATSMAVAFFQEAVGVDPTGEASATLQRYIYCKAAPNNSIRFYDQMQNFTTLSLGDSGDAVTELQRRLWELGLLQKKDIEDSVGTFNNATRYAVADAQLKMGYESSDGVAGPEFQCFLFTRYAEKLKS